MWRLNEWDLRVKFTCVRPFARTFASIIKPTNYQRQEPSKNQNIQAELNWTKRNGIAKIE